VDVEQFFPALNKKGISNALARKVATTLTIALGAAVRLRLRSYNPATGIRKPKAAKPEIKVFDLDEVSRFLKAASSDRLYALYFTFLDTGMRPGELFALGWNDIDFTGGFLQVRRSLEDIAGVLRIKEVKTKKGRRRIDLSARGLDVLHQHRKRMLAEGLADGPVFCDTRGGYLRISNLRKNSFKPILRRAGLPDIRLYELRHTCASLLLVADELAKVVSERSDTLASHLRWIPIPASYPRFRKGLPRR
jgi:integrase